MTEVDRVKCACPDCVCVIPPEQAVKRDGKLYCGDACAKGHDSGSGCGHVGCKCTG
ncbi:metallothionein [Aquisalimonas sp.]|uniref:metallothionein n=1 Tax=Aquisalimonas sp. TaxID=1872621 RepID=UPI0025B8245C|nr:metallothionein [Aquisalimonas sp.]